MDRTVLTSTSGLRQGQRILVEGSNGTLYQVERTGDFYRISRVGHIPEQEPPSLAVRPVSFWVRFSGWLANLWMRARKYAADRLWLK